MNKLTCQICDGELSNELGVTPSVCDNCGANAPLPIEKNVTSGEASPKPKTKNLLPVIFVAVSLTALLMIALFAGGVYWVINKSPVVKPTPRTNNRTSISASEITRIEYTDSKYQKPEYATGYLSNYAMKNFFHRELIVTFDDDGRAMKYFLQQETVNGVGTPQRLERYSGAFAPERFAELAGVFVENDFTGEEESKTSTVSPVNQILTVFYSSQRSKSFQAGNSNSDTPEAEVMLKAFKELENKINWQRVE